MTCECPTCLEMRALFARRKRLERAQLVVAIAAAIMVLVVVI